jgi:hypothetical protein
LSLALLILIGSLAAPAAAQEEDLATLDLVEAQSFESDCEASVFGGTACIHTVEATLRYQLPKPPGIVQCEISGFEVFNWGEAIEFTDTSGTVTTSVTDPVKSIRGGEAADFLGCVLEAEGVYLAVSKHQPHAEMRVEGAPAPEGEPAAGDLDSLIEAGLLDVLAGGATATYTKEELEAYWRARGPACGAPDTPDQEAAWKDCLLARPGVDIAQGIVADFSEDIGVLDEARGDEAENKAVDAVGLTAGLIVEIDHLRRPMFPAVRAGADKIYLLARQVVDDPGAAQRAEQYLNLLIRMDIDRGMRLAEPGNN